MHLEDPLISIIIPNYNRAHLILETLNSLFKQSYINWEAIVVDDGSVDQSAEVVKKVLKGDSRVKFFERDREPKGAPTCRNIGIEKSGGDFIIFLDSDDILAPYCLSTRIKYFKEAPGFDFLVFPMLVFKEKPGDSSLLWNIDTQEDDLVRFLRADTPWSVTCPIWKKEALKRIGSWDETALTWQDWEWHVKAIVLGFKYKKINSLPDSFVRRGADERISLGDLAFERIEYRLQLFLKVYDLLLSYNKLNKNNRYSLANLLFSHAVKSVINNYNTSLPEIFSMQIITLKLIPPFFAYLQAFYIKLLLIVKRLKLRFFSTLFYHLFYLILPEYLIKSNSQRDSINLNVNEFEKVRKMIAVLL